MNIISKHYSDHICRKSGKHSVKLRCWLTSVVLVNLTLLMSSCSSEQAAVNDHFFENDTTEFFDSAHHWYDINDKDKIIMPEPGQQKYPASEIRKIADNIILFQKSNGGWAKNYDMEAELTAEQKEKVLRARDELNTTFDNGATHSQLKYLAKAYFTTREERYKNAFVKGMGFVLSAQYQNGGWPQFYPDTSGYRKYITFNDGAMIGVMELLQKILNNKSAFSFLGTEMLGNINSAFSKGIDCILKCQINENGTLTAWCQQHDNVDFSPRSARSFEPAAICNGESAGIVKFLMSLNKKDAGVNKSINSAVEWFKNSRIYGIRIEIVKAPKADFMFHSTEYDKLVVQDKKAKPIWTRFYQLKTHVPMFCRRSGEIVYTLEEVERERRTGYAWYVYDPQQVLDDYNEWLERIERN